LRYSIIIGLAGVALLGTVAAAAARHGRGDFRAHTSRVIEKLLDVAQATPDQRKAIEAARDEAFAAIAAHQGDRRADASRALELFEADKPDAQEIAALRQDNIVRRQQAAQAIESAVVRAHDTLNADQRNRVVGAIRAFHDHDQHANFGGDHFGFVQRMVASRVDEVMTQIQATPDQRKVVNGAMQQVSAAIQGLRADHTSTLDRALALFAADKIDMNQLSALHAEQDAAWTKVGDTIVSAITQVHDTLSTTQRKALTAYVRSHHHGHG
jgi:hypothetical protein